MGRIVEEWVSGTRERLDVNMFVDSHYGQTRVQMLAEHGVFWSHPSRFHVGVDVWAVLRFAILQSVLVEFL